MADLLITITIPDTARADFLDAYCTRYGWVDLATSGPRAAFARDKARDLVRAPLRAYRRERAEADALATMVVADDGIAAS